MRRFGLYLSLVAMCAAFAVFGIVWMTGGQHETAWTPIENNQIFPAPPIVEGAQLPILPAPPIVDAP
jgi:hypothetical protein